jgi:uncharacterized damage-inducible protein DinB
MSTLEFLLDALDERRERLLVAIEPLDDEALLQKNVVGEWSISDVLTNLTAWESELVTGLLKLDQNKQPVKLMEALADPAGYDRAFYSAMQDRHLDQIFEDLQLVRVQLEDWLSEFSEKDLTNRNRYRGLDGRSLRSVIAEATYRREDTFLPAIEAFSQVWLDTQEPAENVIPLTLLDFSTIDDHENKTD